MAVATRATTCASPLHCSRSRSPAVRPADEDDPGAPGGGQTDAAPAGSTDAGSDEFVEPAFEPDGFQGFGVQLYESLYDPAFVPQSTVDPASPAMRDAMVEVEPGHVRIFVQNEAAVRPDTPEGAAAKESFSRVIDLAQAAGASVNVTWPGGYTGTGADFARLQMEGLAALLHEEVYERGHTAIRYVTIQNEGNTANPDHVCPGQKTGTYICRVDMNTAYRTLDALMRAQDPPLRGPDAPHLIRFIGGDLVYGRGDGDNDNGFQSWMTWMDQNMDDILDGWSIHVYWFYWNQCGDQRFVATHRQRGHAHQAGDGAPERARRQAALHHGGGRARPPGPRDEGLPRLLPEGLHGEPGGLHADGGLHRELDRPGLLRRDGGAPRLSRGHQVGGHPAR